MKIICQNPEYEKDLQDLVNLFYDEEDFPFSLEQNYSLSGNELVSEIEIGSGSNVKKYNKYS